MDLVGLRGNESVPNAVKWTIDPENYITLIDEATNKYQLSLIFDDKAGSVVIGANAMSGYNIVFDGDKNRLAFVRAKCR